MWLTHTCIVSKYTDLPIFILNCDLTSVSLQCSCSSVDVIIGAGESSIHYYTSYYYNNNYDLTSMGKKKKKKEKKN